MSDLRYPVGPWKAPATITVADRARFTQQIAAAPRAVLRAVAGLSEAQLDTPYRDGGWTVRQVIHHVPDSHMNAYIRMKLAVTEDAPAIKTYEEARWAELPEARSGPIEVSLDLLDALHFRWTAFLRALAPADFQRTYLHPEMGVVPLD